MGSSSKTKKIADFPSPQGGTPAMPHIGTEAQFSKVHDGTKPERTNVLLPWAPTAESEVNMPETVIYCFKDRKHCHVEEKEIRNELACSG